MFLRSLSVINFRNIREAAADFSPRLNTFIGDNGAGKSNLLDALYSLSFSKSFQNTPDTLNVAYEEPFFMLQGRYVRKGEEETVVYGFQQGQKKQLKRNGKPYRKMSDHIGLLPLVMVSPYDASIILSGSEERRKFLDGVISQYNPSYLSDLIRYNRILQQRNNLLKQPGAIGQFPGVIDYYDQELDDTGMRIHAERNGFVSNLVPVFRHYYETISGGSETVSLRYESEMHDCALSSLLARNRGNDLAAQYTTAGIHRDDLAMTLERFPLKKTGSQGQQKTFVVALKMAQFEYIREAAGIKPILLLDDIFDKLDRNRVEQIVRIVSGPLFGQIFITDTNREHLDFILRDVSDEYRIFRVESGRVGTVR